MRHYQVATGRGGNEPIVLTSLYLIIGHNIFRNVGEKKMSNQFVITMRHTSAHLAVIRVSDVSYKIYFSRVETP